MGKQIPVNEKLLVRPGLTGCAYWQISDDSDDGPDTLADERKEAFALGAEMNFFFLPQLFQVNLRVLREFEAKNTVEGSQFVLTPTKSWSFDTNDRLGDPWLGLMFASPFTPGLKG